MHCYINLIKGKSQNRSEFALGSENMLNELKNIENPVEMNNFDDADNHYPFGYYKNISSNVVHNIKPKSGKLRRLANPAEVAKSSTIIVLERERLFFFFTSTVITVKS